MRKGANKGFVVLATIVVAFFVGISLGTSNLYALMEEIPLARIANESDLIVKGKIIASETRELNNKKGAIYTFVELLPETVLKGELPKSKIIIRTEGGCAPSGLCMASSNAPTYKLDEDVIVFLTKEGDIYVTTYLFQGKYTLKQDGIIKENGEAVQAFIEKIENILK